MQKHFSYPLIVEDISSGEQHYHLTASPDNLQEIAEILQIPSAESFEADIYTKLNKKEHLLRVWGNLNATLRLQSVISLEYFSKTYSPDFEVVFDTKATFKSQKEEEVDFEEDLPDIVIDGKIDLAEIALEQLALVLEDYPRQEGEVFEWKSEFSPEDTEKENPFKILASLKK